MDVVRSEASSFTSRKRVAEQVLGWTIFWAGGQLGWTAIMFLLFRHITFQDGSGWVTLLGGPLATGLGLLLFVMRMARAAPADRRLPTVGLHRSAGWLRLLVAGALTGATLMLAFSPIYRGIIGLQSLGDW